jgi:S1-C subfamily serine protease
MTNKHVIQDLHVDYEVVWSDGTRQVMSNYWLDPLMDVALIKVEESPSLADIHPLRAV